MAAHPLSFAYETAKANLILAPILNDGFATAEPFSLRGDSLHAPL